MAPSLTELSDEELLVRARDASDEEVREIVGIVARRWAGKLKAYLTRFVGDRTEAEDLTQRTFVRLLRHARRYKEIAKVSTWLYRIAHNLGCNELRRRSYRPDVSLDQPVGAEDGARALGELVPGETRPPDDLAESADTSRFVREAVARLPEPYRDTLVLVDLRGYTYQEAADALEIKLGTVRSRLYRARSKLEDELEPHVDAL